MYNFAKWKDLFSCALILYVIWRAIPFCDVTESPKVVLALTHTFSRHSCIMHMPDTENIRHPDTSQKICFLNEIHFNCKITHSFRQMSFIYPILDLHVAGVACKPGGAYSSGAPGLASMLEVHVYPLFCRFYVQRIIWTGLTLRYIESQEPGQNDVNANCGQRLQPRRVAPRGGKLREGAMPPSRKGVWWVSPKKILKIRSHLVICGDFSGWILQTFCLYIFQ